VKTALFRGLGPLDEEIQNPAAGTGVGADYAVGENDWQRDTQNQNEWIPGFGKMVSNTTISERHKTTVSSGSCDATRRLESLSEDTQDHLRGHLNGHILSTTATEGRDRGCAESHFGAAAAASVVQYSTLFNNA
jgi:hypothetical protein